MTHADLNGDGAPDLVAITSDGYVHAYDVKHGTLLWKSTSIGGGADLEVADVDGDGEQEIVALSGARLVLFRKAPSGPTPWLESASVAVSGTDLAIGDCDGDGAPELYALGGTSVARFDGALAPKGSFTVRGTAQSLFVEDLGFARKNLVLGKGDSWAYSGTAAYLEAVDAVTGAQIWESPPVWGTVPVNSLGYVDLDGDGLREMAFGTTAGMYLTRSH
jgi:outer membrane protein assembly factor BamB